MTSIRHRLALLPRQLQHRTLFTNARPVRSTYMTPSAMFAQARTMSVASAQLQSVRPSEIPNTRSVLVSSPSVEDLEEQELDVDLIPTAQINVVLTDRAAEVIPPFLVHPNSSLTQMVATSTHIHATREPRRSPTHIRRIRRMPRIPI